MGLFSALFGTDVSRHWVAEQEPQLNFNFDDFALCGVHLGDRVERLSELGLGPAEDARAARKGLLRYYSLGLELSVHHEEIAGFVLVWAWPNELECPFASFTGRCVHHHRDWPLHRETNFLDVTARLGEPIRREDHEDSYTFVYRFNGVLLEVDFDTLDLLNSIAVSAD